MVSALTKVGCVVTDGQGKEREVVQRRLKLFTGGGHLGELPGEEFVAEKIVNHRIVNKGSELEFRVRWEGYSFREDTWEPLAHITQHLLDEYRDSLPGRVHKKLDTLLDKLV